MDVADARRQRTHGEDDRGSYLILSSTCGISSFRALFKGNVYSSTVIFCKLSPRQVEFSRERVSGIKDAREHDVVSLCRRGAEYRSTSTSAYLRFVEVERDG